MIDTNSIISGIIGVAGGGAGIAIIQSWFNRSRVKADASSINTDAAQVLLGKTLSWSSDLTARIVKLEAKVAEQEALINSLTKINTQLAFGCSLPECPIRKAG
jgi:hypothetical protein